MSPFAYTLLPSNEEPKSPAERETKPCGRSRFRKTIFVTLHLLVLCVIASGAFLAGRYSVTDISVSGFHQHTVKQTFQYNRTFAESSPETDLAWSALIPAHGGFFHYPPADGARATFSGFHTLHCLNDLRQSWWELYGAAMAGRRLDVDKPEDRDRQMHARHCIDLLRHSLMCHADDTVEIVNQTLGGVRGFGVQRQCRSWDRLVRQAEAWQ